MTGHVWRSLSATPPDSTAIPYGVDPLTHDPIAWRSWLAAWRTCGGPIRGAILAETAMQTKELKRLKAESDAARTPLLPRGRA